MKSRRFSFILLAVAVATGSVAIAQEPPGKDDRLAPLSKKQDSERTSHYFATIHAQEFQNVPIYNSDLLRRAALTGSAINLLKRSDPVMAVYFDSEDQPREFTDMKLAVGPDGTVTSCTFDGKRNSSPELAESLCPIIRKRARFTPALGLDGQRKSDYHRISVSFQHRRSFGTDRPLAVSRLALSPPPRMVRPVGKPSSWPVMTLGFDSRPHLRKRAILGVAKAPIGADEHVAGIAISAEQGEDLRCINVVPAGHADFDAAACPFFMKKFKPRLQAANPYSPTEYAFLIVGKNKPKRAIEGANRLAKRARPKNPRAGHADQPIAKSIAEHGGDTEDVLLMLSVSKTGAVFDCRILRTAGNDAADIAACATARKTVTYEPAKDVFGRPVEARWNTLYLR